MYAYYWAHGFDQLREYAARGWKVVPGMMYQHYHVDFTLCEVVLMEFDPREPGNEALPVP